MSDLLPTIASDDDKDEEEEEEPSDDELDGNLKFGGMLVRCEERAVHCHMISDICCC